MFLRNPKNLYTNLFKPDDRKTQTNKFNTVKLKVKKTIAKIQTIP